MLRALGGKTLWDWLQLLIVPLALAVIGFAFTLQQDARQQKIEDERAWRAQEIEQQRAQAERYSRNAPNMLRCKPTWIRWERCCSIETSARLTRTAT